MLRVALLSIALAGCESVFPLSRDCPDTYTQTPTGCYRAIDEPATFIAAEGDCELDRGHLAVIDSPVELAAVSEVLSTRSIEQAFVGLFATEPFNYRWITDEGLRDPPPGGFPWADGEPTNTAGDDSGVLRTDIGGLASFPSEQKFGYACEIDDFVADPERY